MHSERGAMQETFDAAKLLDLLREVTVELQLDLTDVGPETTLQEMNLDSLDQLEFLTALEDRTGQRIPDEKVGEIKTIQDIINCLLDLQRAGGPRIRTEA